MKIYDVIRRAGRTIRSAKTRTILTSLAIAVGAFTLSVALAAGEGSRQYANDLITNNFDPSELAIAKDESFFSAEGGPAGGGPKEYDPDAGERGGVVITRLTQEDINKIANVEGVERVLPAYQPIVEYITRGDDYKKYTAEVASYRSGIKQEVSAGVLPELGSSISQDEIVIPESYVKLLGFNSPADAIDQPVTLHLERRNTIDPEKIQSLLAEQGPEALENLSATEPKDIVLNIAAVTRQSATTFNFAGDIMIAESQAKELTEFISEGTDDFQKYIIAAALVEDSADPNVVADRIDKLGYEVRTAEDLQEFLFTVVNILQGIVFVFGILALIASVFGVINTQYISVLERTQQIGLMKALGMKRSDVLKLFLIEAAWLGFLGGVIGATLAYVVGILINPQLSAFLSLGDENSLLVFQPIPIILMIVGLMIIAVLAGMLPALKAAKLDPIEALRTE